MLLLIVQNWHYLLFDVQLLQTDTVGHLTIPLLQLVFFKFLQVTKKSMSKNGVCLIISLNYNVLIKKD